MQLEPGARRRLPKYKHSQRKLFSFINFQIMMHQKYICVYFWCFPPLRGSNSWMLDSIVTWPRHDQSQVTGFNVPAQSLYLALRRLPRLTYYVHPY